VCSTAAVVTVRTSESEEGEEGAGTPGGWHPQLAHLPQLPHPLRRRLQVKKNTDRIFF
jgi:hypothetical protein